MSKHLVTFLRTKRLDPSQPMPPDERRALINMKKNAVARGATLHNKGRGGLPPSLVYHVLKRDEFRCKKCGDSIDLTVHHKGGVPISDWLRKKAHTNSPNNIVTLCDPCHDAVHDDGRKILAAKEGSGGADPDPRQA